MAFDPSTPIIKTNITALRANVSPYENINTQGFYVAADGGGGLYYYNPSDTTSTDNGGTIIVDAAGHRYYRVTTVALPPRQINTNTTLTSAYLNQFINPYATCVLVLPHASTCPLGSTINFTNTGGSTTINCATGSDAILVSSSTVTSITLNNGDTLILASALNGSTPAWLALGGSAQFPASATGALYAPLASPAFTGTPTAPTPSPGDSSTKLATTAFVSGVVVGTAGVTVTPVTASGAVNPTAASQEILIEKTVPATTSIVLPAASNWPNCPTDALSCPVYVIKDIAYNSGTYPITITTEDSLDIEGSPSLVINSNGAAVSLTLAGGFWYAK